MKLYFWNIKAVPIGRQYNIIVKPRLLSHTAWLHIYLCNFLAMWTQKSYLTPLSLFLLQNMDDHSMKIKMKNIGLLCD